MRSCTAARTISATSVGEASLPNASAAPISATSTAPIEQAIRTRCASGIAGFDEEAAELLLEVLVLGLVALVAREPLERVVVALVEQEQVAVRHDLIDELVEQPRPGVGGSAVAEPAELVERRRAPSACSRRCSSRRMSSLRLEVVVERRLRDAEPLGDLAQRRLVVALLGEQLERDVEDPLARRPRRASARRRGAARRCVSGLTPCSASYLTAG